MGRSAISATLSDAFGDRVGSLEGSDRRSATPASGGIHSDDLRREVYCILGLPIDAIEMPNVLSRIRVAAEQRTPFVLSTPNLNFLVRALTDPEFRQTVLYSDLCPPDGMPIVWVARLMGLPIRSRIAGSDIFDALMAMPRATPRLKVFLFGGADGVAAAASKAINAKGNGIRCVGAMSPGYGSVEDLSHDRTIEQINASNANFLIAALGALKGQLWLHRNHSRLNAPIRAHLGAVINFQASTVRRAPVWLKNAGLEWAWRIKEEPHLWKRYLLDGSVLLRLLATHVVPLAMSVMWRRLRGANRQDLVIMQAPIDKSVKLTLVGAATSKHIGKATACLRTALRAKGQVIIDVSHAQWIDARFFGLLLMFRKQLAKQGTRLIFTGVSPRLERIFRLNGVKFLLAAESGM